MKLTAAELDSAMTEMNPDGSAEVGFEKFEAWWKGGQKGSAGKCQRNLHLLLSGLLRGRLLQTAFPCAGAGMGSKFVGQFTKAQKELEKMGEKNKVSGSQFRHGLRFGPSIRMMTLSTVQQDFIVSPGAVTSSFLSSKMKGLTSGVKVPPLHHCSALQQPPRVSR